MHFPLVEINLHR
uniref:Uncharacterized protein n=1 Tax=Arundo donax TaxID=35708 RepID=A0A0A9H9Y0_ARUDO